MAQPIDRVSVDIVPDGVRVTISPQALAGGFYLERDQGGDETDYLMSRGKRVRADDELHEANRELRAKVARLEQDKVRLEQVMTESQSRRDDAEKRLERLGFGWAHVLKNAQPGGAESIWAWDVAQRDLNKLANLNLLDPLDIEELPNLRPAVQWTQLKRQVASYTASPDRLLLKYLVPVPTQPPRFPLLSTFSTIVNQMSISYNDISPILALAQRGRLASTRTLLVPLFTINAWHRPRTGFPAFWAISAEELDELVKDAEGVDRVFGYFRVEEAAYVWMWEMGVPVEGEEGGRRRDTLRVWADHQETAVKATVEPCFKNSISKGEVDLRLTVINSPEFTPARLTRFIFRLYAVLPGAEEIPKPEEEGGSDANIALYWAQMLDKEANGILEAVARVREREGCVRDGET